MPNFCINPLAGESVDTNFEFRMWMYFYTSEPPTVSAFGFPLDPDLMDREKEEEEEEASDSEVSKSDSEEEEEEEE